MLDYLNNTAFNPATDSTLRFSDGEQGTFRDGTNWSVSEEDDGTWSAFVGGHEIISGVATRSEAKMAAVEWTLSRHR